MIIIFINFLYIILKNNLYFRTLLADGNWFSLSVPSDTEIGKQEKRGKYICDIEVTFFNDFLF